MAVAPRGEYGLLAGDFCLTPLAEHFPSDIVA